MRNNLVKCSNCDLNFLSREGMEKHFKRVHLPKESGNVTIPKTRFKCENCDEEFNTKLDFKKHRDPQKLLCKKCQEDKKKFICDNKCELIKHVRKMHQKDLMIKKQNIIEAKRQEKLQKKRQMHQQQSQVKNFTPRHQCLKCQKVFKDNNFLELHMKEDHSNKDIKQEMVVEMTGKAKRFSSTARITQIAPKPSASLTPASGSSSAPSADAPPSSRTRTTVELTPRAVEEPLQHFYYKTFTAEELIRLGIFTETSASTFVPPPLVETITGDLDSPPEHQKITAEETTNEEPPSSLEGVFILGL